MAKVSSKQYILGGGGVKAINPEHFPEESWSVLTGGGEPTSGLSSLYTTVGYLRRCIDIRAATLSSLPWRVMAAAAEKDDDPLWDSESLEVPRRYQDLPVMEEMLYLTEASLILTGAAYWFKVGFPNRPQLKWFAASSMEPKWDGTEGLVAFKRRLGGGREPQEYPVEEIAYLRFSDPFHETKELAPLALAVARDASAIANLDSFVEDFFKRGAIKMTLLSVDRTVPDDQRRRLKSWWQKAVQGVKSAWEVMVLSSSVSATVIGEGVSELGNMQLTESKQKSIATGIGVPHSIVMSNAANRATSESDTYNFYTFTIIPEARVIQRLFNEQLFTPLGLHFEFLPETLAVFQEDEEQRAGAFKTYVDAGLKKSLVAEILGLKLPKGFEYKDLDEQEPEEEEEPQKAPTDSKEDSDPEVEAEAKRFRVWAKKRLGRETFDTAEFVSDLLTEEAKGVLIDELKGGPGSGNFGHRGRGEGAKELERVATYEFDPEAIY